MGSNNPSIPDMNIETKITDYAYINREDLTEVSLPSGIKSIGERAFAQCINLKKVLIPDTVEYIGASAFSGCYNLEEIILPTTLKKINYRTFGDCVRLKRIVIPEGVEELDWGVFSGCSNLEEIHLPTTLKNINNQAFLNCKRLKKINIPENITTLPDECFRGCVNLNIKLNPNIKTIGNKCFQDCHKLSFFPENVIKFGDNCFKNCKSIKSANINNVTLSLPDGMFDGCVNLTNIEMDKDINIGKRCFRNCKSLTSIPNFVNNFNESSFENCTGLEKISIISDTISTACFRGCKNLKEIENQDNIFKMEPFAFSGCESLKSFDAHNLSIIPAEAFSNCKNLKTVKLGSSCIDTIDTRAFYNCQNLEDIVLPDTLKAVRKEAFKNCSSIKSINIPANLKTIGDEAFSYMDSLENIDVSYRNPHYFTPDNKILISSIDQRLVLYASGLKDKSYSLESYNVQNSDSCETIVPLNSISEYAFAGAKALEELTICGCTQDIDATAFYGCDNLKKLNILAIPLYTCLGIHTKNHGNYYNEELDKNKAYMPFEEVTFDGELVAIIPNALENFKNVKKISLPKDKSFKIGSLAFKDCSKLEKVFITDNINSIDINAFNPNTKIEFSNGINSKGFTELVHDNNYIGDYKLYVLDDGTYYIEQNNNIKKITKQQIDKICSHSEFIINNPILFIDFMRDLIRHDLAIRQLFNGILMSTMSLENRKILFNNLKKNDKFFLTVLKNSKLLDEKDRNTELLLQDKEFEKVVNYIELLRKNNITNPLLHNKLFMANMNIDYFQQLINYDLELFIKTLKQSGLLEEDTTITLVYNGQEDKKPSYYLTYQIIEKNTLLDFMRLVKKYNIKDKYLFNKVFIACAKNPLLDTMFKVYDANIKRLLKLSQITNNNISATQNLDDLLILMKITGALEEDPIIRQKAATFICEKLFDENLPNGEKNKYRIVGDDIHRIFNFPLVRKEYDQEFVTFFLENYQELIKEEKNKSGFIQRVYLNFKQISKTCTSNKGSQRKLKVTMDKCINYLSKVKFDGITEDNKLLAKLIGEWYDDNKAWLNAQRIYDESLNAPRNIFTKTRVLDDGTIVYDMSRKHDLKEDINANFSYQWLPKQDYDNLILGKYCNCCAHVSGAGDGIMRASMILDNCQNLVIRNDLGEIIAKATLYVNKDEGYAVFNNVESSMNYRDSESLKKIYYSFLRGTKAFIETYNKNNPETPIKNISIGTRRNTILDFLKNNDIHPEIDVQKSLDFRDYSLRSSGYNGDWSTSQRIVLKR